MSINNTSSLQQSQGLNRLVCVKSDERRGRYIEALEDIPCGIVVCDEIGIVFGMKSSCCSFCLQEKGIDTRIHCNECLKLSEMYDKYEAPFWEELSQLGMVGLAIRVLLSFSPKVYDDHFCNDRHPEDCRFTNIYRLKRSDELDDFSIIEDFLFRFQQHLTSVSSEWNAAQHLFRMVFEEIFSRLKTNAHVIHSISSNSDKPDGTGIYPLSSIFNHSCRANIYSFFHNNRFIWISMGIRKGEEVLDNYGVQAHSVDYEERQYFLKGRGFDCQCAVCAKGPDDTLLLIPEELKIPEKLSYFGVLELIKNKTLSSDHIAIYHMLEEIVSRRDKGMEECFDLLISNQFSRGVIFEPILITQYLCMVYAFKDSKAHSEKVVDWLMCALFLIRLYCLNLHPRLEEANQLLLQMIDKRSSCI